MQRVAGKKVQPSSADDTCAGSVIASAATVVQQQWRLFRAADIVHHVISRKVDLPTSLSCILAAAACRLRWGTALVSAACGLRIGPHTCPLLTARARTSAGGEHCCVTQACACAVSSVSTLCCLCCAGAQGRGRQAHTHAGAQALACALWCFQGPALACTGGSDLQMCLQARKGEGDRHIPTLRPKHLLVGHRGKGKTDRR